ncbi:MAG: hypothetical protein HYR85_06320 [Planctomycetes bacterium]|nr:hypothetical protein [Planctomycetota bacterium]MBI3843044.1 hypothetical protein [Planctomycetota bacterium]
MAIDGISGFSTFPPKPPGQPGKKGDVNARKAPAGEASVGSTSGQADFRSSATLTRLKSVATSSRSVLDGRPDAIAAARARLLSGALETPEALRTAAARVVEDRRGA